MIRMNVTIRMWALAMVVYCISAQSFFSPANTNELVHADVESTAAQEALLPASLKNPFYQNPKIRAALAKSSWFGPGERPVKAREAHRIPRKEIFIVLKHAGLLPQQQL